MYYCAATAVNESKLDCLTWTRYSGQGNVLQQFQGAFLLRVTSTKMSEVFCSGHWAKIPGTVIW